MIELLNESQREAADSIGQFLNSETTRSRSFTLTGGPGTGKTFMLRAALKEYSHGKTVICATISHAARNVLSDALADEYPCYTIAQLLGLSMRINETDGSYFFVESKGAFKKIEEARNAILVLDEVSMIDDELYHQIMRQVYALDIKCIAVGDPYQLPPVEQEHDSLFFEEIDATLRIPMRFGGSLASLAGIYHDAIKGLNADEAVSNWVLNEATLRQDNMTDGLGYKFERKLDIITSTAADLIKENYEDKNHTRVLAFKNSHVDALNDAIRTKIYGEKRKQFEEGEIVICNGGYSYENKPILYNGEILKVEEYMPFDKHPSTLPALKVRFRDIDHSTLPPIYTLPNDPKIIKKHSEMKEDLIYRAKRNPRLWGNYKAFMNSFAGFTYGYAQNLYKA